MKVAYFDCFAGISGDMIMGSLLDAGLDLNILRNELSKLPLSGYEISADKVLKNGISATKFNVRADTLHDRQGSHQEISRKLPDIEKIINESRLDDTIKSSGLDIFRRIGSAEAAIHGININEIHFHEIGGIDSIIDIIGAAIAMSVMGIVKVYASRIHIGQGFVETMHGTIPVPSPATVSLLKGVPVYSTGIESELTTPTGAAILTHYSEGFGPLPPMDITAAGYGAGARDLAIPNLLRVIIGESSEIKIRSEQITVLETNIDDMNPEFYEHISQMLFSNGALDVCIIPVIMKKSRPGAIVKVISHAHAADRLIDVIFSETTTSGIRVNAMERRTLDRDDMMVSTAFGDISVKIIKRGNEIITVSPEYESCRSAASSRGIPLKDVYEEAKRKAYEIIR